MQFFILLSSLSITAAYWACPTNPVLRNVSTDNVFPNGPDLYYGNNANCNFRIDVPNGMFAILTVYTYPDYGDNIIGWNKYVNVEFGNNTYNMATVGPDSSNFNIQSSASSRGAFQVHWILRNVSFPNPQNLVISQGQQPIVVETYDLFQSARIISSQDGDSIAISTASLGKVIGDEYTLTGAFVYQGSTPTTPPIECLYNRLYEKSPLILNGTITLVFFALSGFETGAFSINAYSDVKSYYQYQFLYHANIGHDGRFVLDATNGSAAVTLYQEDSSQSIDIMLSYKVTVNNQTTLGNTTYSLYAGGLPVSNQQLLSTYGIYPTADYALPQWIPGRLKTFTTNRGAVSVIVNASESGLIAPYADLLGFFKTENYLFNNAQQNLALSMQSDEPLFLIMNSVAVDSQTTITVSTTGVQSPDSCKFTSSAQNCTIYGTNFKFSSTSILPSTGGLINYYYYSNSTITTPSSAAGNTRCEFFILTAIILMSLGQFLE